MTNFPKYRQQMVKNFAHRALKHCGRIVVSPVEMIFRYVENLNTDQEKLLKDFDAQKEDLRKKQREGTLNMTGSELRQLLYQREQDLLPQFQLNY